MPKIGFFRTPQPRKFNYVPMYYDAEKEAFENRVRQIEAKYKVENENGKEYVPGIRRGSMRAYFKTSSSQQKKRSNIRLLIVLIILFLLASYMFFVFKI